MKKEETKIEKASVREAMAKEIKNPELRGLVNEGVRSMNKIIIIDQETVITGSFNFTKAAEEKSSENLLILKNKDLARFYVGNWEKHKEHSVPYEGGK